MHRFWEILLGLDRGFLARNGDLSLQFDPQWPGQKFVGAGLWNLLLAAAIIALVVWVYRREARSRAHRITLAILRGLLLGLVLLMLNRPILLLVQSRTEPSVVAVLIDDSLSMGLHDAGNPARSRMDAVIDLLAGQDAALLRSLAARHTLRFYRFDETAQSMGAIPDAAALARGSPESAGALDALHELRPQGQHTQVIRSLRAVLEELQGQHLAGIVLLTDGRDAPAEPLADSLGALREYAAVPVFAVPVGSDQPPRSVQVQSVSVQDVAFAGDIVNVKATVRGSGLEPGHSVLMRLADKSTGQTLPQADGSPAEKQIQLADDKSVEVEIQFEPRQVGSLDMLVQAMGGPGMAGADQSNVREVHLEVLDAKISVLYVEGYPRWEYRYIKTQMIRDKTVSISCLLTSADPTFVQEGTRPITRFPETIQELLDYDVVVFGDVDPRQFTDTQLQLVNEFVTRKGGGFAMVAGPRWSPQAYVNTPIEPLLPVFIRSVEPTDASATIVDGFRPVLTREGREGTASSIFRFFADKAVNDRYLTETMPPVFWYCRGVTVKPGVGEVYAEHPTDIGPDGRKAPILVLGRSGGRTLFSAIDESWRWRFYTGESIFDTYWVQQLRYLARGKKVGQRGVTLASVRPHFELGEQVQVSMHVLDPQILAQLPDQIRVDIVDPAGQLVRRESLIRQDGSSDDYELSYTADRVGQFTVRTPPLTAGSAAMSASVDVSVPGLELADPRVDRMFLSRLAGQTLGKVVEVDQARSALPKLIHSAAKIIPVPSRQALWDAPLALALFAAMIIAEWVIRKMYGMV